jgi:RNA polymerase sigma-70 factor (ECF subfamily)
MVAQHYHNFSDEKLLNLTCQKDPTAFAMLYDRHAQVVYTLLLRMVRERETAEDLLQETFWQVWQKAEQYDGSGLPTAWLYRVARNKGLDQLRHRRARPQAAESDLETLEHLPIFHECSAEVEVERRWIQQIVVNALEHIPDAQQQALELTFFTGLNQREIAEQTNMPLGTIKTRISIGIKKIKRLLVGLGVGTGQI